MPIEPDVRAALGHHLTGESHQVHGSGRCGVADGVAQAQALGSGPNRGLEQLPQGLRLGAHRVLGHVHDRQSVGHRERHRLFRVPEHRVQGPILGVLADRRGADEGAHLDRDPRLLGDLDHRQDVLFEGAGGAVRLDLEPGVCDLLRQPHDVAHHVGSRTGQTDVGRVDAEPLHQVQDTDLVLDRRCLHRGRLEAVAQRLVIELDASRRALPALAGIVPIVDQLAFVHRLRASWRPTWPERHGGERSVNRRRRLAARGTYVRSTITAIPCPPPMHAEAMPQRFWRFPSSTRSV